MKLTVFGATGGTGAEVLRQALDAGHEVRAVARHPEEAVTRPASAQPDRLTVLAADVLESASLVDAVTGADAVVSALGGRRGTPVTVYSAGTTAIVHAMHETGVARFVAISAAPASPPGEKTALERLVAHPLLERVFGVYDDMRAMEQILAASDLDWTVFRPPRLLNRPGTGRYRCAVGRPIPRGWTLPRADLATAMLAAVLDGSFIRQAVAIAT